MNKSTDLPRLNHSISVSLKPFMYPWVCFRWCSSVVTQLESSSLLGVDCIVEPEGVPMSGRTG